MLLHNGTILHSTEHVFLTKISFKNRCFKCNNIKFHQTNMKCPTLLIILQPQQVKLLELSQCPEYCTFYGNVAVELSKVGHQKWDQYSLIKNQSII